MTTEENKALAKEIVKAQRQWTIKSIVVKDTEFTENTAVTPSVWEARISNNAPFLVAYVMGYAGTLLSQNLGTDGNSGDSFGAWQPDVAFNLPENPLNNNLCNPNLGQVLSPIMGIDPNALNEASTLLQIKDENKTTQILFNVVIYEYSKYS